MSEDRTGQIAVIFCATRRAEDEPGYCGIDGIGAADGVGITAGRWADEASAIAWRDHRGHARIRDAYTVAVATVERRYAWPRA